MRYAMVESGTVTNIIWLYEGNAADFPGAIPLADRPVGIGDHYADGVFSRDGIAVLTPLESAQTTIGELDRYVLDLELDNVMLSLDLQ